MAKMSPLNQAAKIGGLLLLVLLCVLAAKNVREAFVPIDPQMHLRPVISMASF